MLLSIRDAASQGVFFAIMTMGVYISFKILDQADMSVDGTFVLGAAIATMAITTKNVNPILAVIFSMLGGMLAGMVNGFLHTKLKIPAVLSGILTMLSLYSINLKIMKSPNVSYLDEHKTIINMLTAILPIGRNTAGLIVGGAYSIIVMLVLYWFFGTEIGGAIRATGDNEDMVRALGISTDSTKILGLVISNGLVALAGGLLSQSQRYADINMGIGVIAEGLVAIIIADVFLNKESSFLLRLFMLIVSAILYRIIVTIAINLGLPSNDLKLLTSIIVVLTLFIPILRNNWLPTFKHKIEHKKKYNNGGKTNA